MGMDLDWIFAKAKIDELEKYLGDIPHGERQEVADEIIEMIDKYLESKSVKK
jgi:hypothetical protein